MLILVGLGNPGGQYAGNRHNIGFMAVDAIAQAHAFGPWRSKFNALVSEGAIQAGGRPVKTLLMKPQTYYNESGQAVGEAARFFRVAPEDIVVFHDELDLAPGKFRMKLGGGHAGNNGMRSIAAHVGAAVRRARIGIGHPGDKAKVTGHVLSDFPKADQGWLSDLLDAIARSADLLAAGELDAFQTRVTHLAPAPAPADPRGTPQTG
jgi:PTH1 family peptidyl-tRNA hydrolase